MFNQRGDRISLKDRNTQCERRDSHHALASFTVLQWVILLYLTLDICAKSHQQISWWFCMGVSEIRSRLKNTLIDNSFLSVSLRTLSIKVNAIIFILLRLRLEEIQDCNVLGTLAFGPEEQKNNCREDISSIKMWMKNLYWC